MSYLLYALVALYYTLQADCSPASPPQTNSSTNLTAPSSGSWTSWKDVENLFVFGDSYSSTGFNINGPQPSPSNPIGNPTYPGDTTIGSPDWTNYLTTTYNEASIKLFNLAFPGGIIDDKIDPSPYGALSFRQQVDQFLHNYINGQGGWTAPNSLFLTWFGVNDVLLLNAKANASAYIDALTESYVGTAEKLYTAGARNFVFLNIPAVDRVPQPKASSPQLSAAITSFQVFDRIVTMNLEMSPDELSRLGRYIQQFNTAMQTMTGSFRQLYPEATVWLFDTNTLFNRVLDDPTSYRLTAGVVNTTADCAPYRHSPDPKLFRPECGVSRDRYFWADGLHPTSTVHQLVAEQVVELLRSGDVARA